MYATWLISLFCERFFWILTSKLKYQRNECWNRPNKQNHWIFCSHPLSVKSFINRSVSHECDSSTIRNITKRNETNKQVKRLASALLTACGFPFENHSTLIGHFTWMKFILIKLIGWSFDAKSSSYTICISCVTDDTAF